MDKVSLCFVCLGNICRSPTAEAIMLDISARENANWLSICSAATSSWETGNSRDPRAVQEGKKRGITIEGKSTQLLKSDVHKHDMFLVMDTSNYADIHDLFGSEHTEKIFMLGAFENYDGEILRFVQDDVTEQNNVEIKDPYYNGGFDKTFEQISRSCEGLYKHLSSSQRIST